MRLTKEDAVVRARALLTFGVSASLAIVTGNMIDLGHAILGIERTLEELKAYHAPRMGWIIANDEDELGSEG